MTTVNPNDLDRDRLLTSHEAGALLQVNPSSINKWVEEGRLPAFRTPGGHRRIRAADLAAFLDAHKMPIPRSLTFAVKRRVLLVDDEPKQVESFKRLLKPHMERLDVAVTTSGIDALVKVGSFKPHVIVLDVYMPDVDGIEVCRRLKQNPETKGIDVIVTSGQMTASVEKKAIEAGARACLGKPLEVDVVLKAIGLGPREIEY
jgi:excisionase family DNA binding protein